MACAHAYFGYGIQREVCLRVPEPFSVNAAISKGGLHLGSAGLSLYVVRCSDTCQLARCIASLALGPLENPPSLGDWYDGTAVDSGPKLVGAWLAGAIVHNSSAVCLSTWKRSMGGL